MGQHKTNPTAILAKEGKLPPKPERKSKRQTERELMAMLSRATGMAKLYEAMGIKKIYGGGGVNLDG